MDALVLAVTAAIGSRLWFTVADVASVAVTLLVLKLVGKGSPKNTEQTVESVSH